jgi:nitrite reductase/ring-hydroxylating ferredoxin subunit
MSWVRVCRVAEVPAGWMRAFPVAGLGIPVLVADLGGGRFAASSGICPHEDVMLEAGDLEGGRVVCPGHGYQFDLETGRCTHDQDLRLRRFPVQVVGDEIHIRIDLIGVSG